ncbi:MAG: permease [Deltaproteobacteria bacterium RIFOXYA12_FULL_58_15]|nr:MAG: permease [Deltaproteobacteria bacterium RIFOXYA12_FULL_58_15]OGR09733.1 MAG: permease [Deltaproteobacteria bacterium RIFOXYB12_FULL_58_9]
MPQGKGTWRFPAKFWSANVAELFERAAYYGVFIGLAVYLTRNYGFTDVQAGWVAAYLAAGIYLAPTLAGAWADRVGFRKALMFAFGLLTSGYFLLGLFGTPAVAEILGGGSIKFGALVALTLILLGGSLVKPVISGTVAKSSDETNRARAFSIFYQVVNIGAFLGKTLALPLRTELGLEFVSFYSAVMALCGLFAVMLFYRTDDSAGEGKSYREIGRGFLKVFTNFRFLSLILIVGGFWAIQGQLYASMPKYVLRMVGEGARPEWLANVNPFVVVVLVVPITQLVKTLKPITSIGIGLFIIPFTALAISLSPVLEQAFGQEISIMGFVAHPITIALIVGIGLQGLAECFLSPRFLEYASKQAPPGEEGLYMGYSHLTTFFAWAFGFVISGYLLDAFCPDPNTLSTEVREAYFLALKNHTALPEVYAHAHYIWYVFTGIGVAAFLALLTYAVVTKRLDRRSSNTTI